MSKRFLQISLVGTITLFPFLVFAETKTLASLILTIIGYLNSILYLIMGVAIVMFVFYVIKYFMRPSTDRAEAWNYVIYSIFGFFVVLSFWGIVNILTNTFNLGNNNPSSWSSVANIFPSGGGSSGSNNVFNQGVPSYNSLPANNYYSGYTSGGSSGTNNNLFGVIPSSNKHSSGSNSGTARTSTKGGASAPSGSKITKAVCSKYFNICVSDSSGARGMVLKDSNQDIG